MKNGDKAFLIPGRSKANITGTPATVCRVNEVFKSMTEEVTIISLQNSTGNAKVRDSERRVFYCNPRDLRPFTSEIL
jgi:hypothetical protein